MTKCCTEPDLRRLLGRFRLRRQCCELSPAPFLCQRVLYLVKNAQDDYCEAVQTSVDVCHSLRYLVSERFIFVEQLLPRQVVEEPEGYLHAQSEC